MASSVPGHPGREAGKLREGDIDADPPINVLVTAAGRRTGLVRAFVEATHARGGRTVAGDVDGLAPALYVADDAVQTLRSDDAGYVANLAATVRERRIGLIVPTIDTDLPVLATHRDELERAGARLAVSSASFVATTLDKVSTASVFGAAGVDVPRAWLPPFGPDVDLPEDVFVKPRRGSASQDAQRATRAEVDGILERVPGAVVQELLDGPEITIDALLDLDGRPIHFVPRFRIKTIGGESVQGVTLDHDEGLETWIEGVLRVSAGLGAIGPLTLQAFLTARGPVLSEINPRFGGGFPLALAAGGSYPAWLLDMVSGRVVEPRLREYTTGLHMTRAYVEHFVQQPMW
jgi:carbamoyl-phosphate synthase large subunit